MRTQTCTWSGVTATVYFLDKGEKVARHQHPIEHSTIVLAGSANLELFGLVTVRSGMMPGQPAIPLPANVDHEITAAENGTIVLNMIVGQQSGDGPIAAAGGVMLEDGTVV